MKNPALWQQLDAFTVDEGTVALSFIDRLARENGWSRAYTLRVMDEYKKFLYLGCVLDHPVTPSDEVDQAWHLHLTYTESYWERLCGEVLQRPFHHGPTKGGQAEGVKFVDWYERTKADYETEFGTAPPEDIWPSTEERFRKPERFKRMDLEAHWMVPKPTKKSFITAAIAATCLLNALVLWGCSGQFIPSKDYAYAEVLGIWEVEGFWAKVLILGNLPLIGFMLFGLYRLVTYFEGKGGGRGSGCSGGAGCGADGGGSGCGGGGCGGGCGGG